MATKAITKYRTRAPKKTRRRGKNRFTLPLSVIVPLSVVGAQTVNDVNKHGMLTALKFLGGNMTGFAQISGEPMFKLSRLKYGLAPILVGLLVHKFAGKLGVNRALSSAGVPWIRI